jgi:hypothetical protein
VDVPIKLWRKGNPEIESKCRVVLAVDAVAFRPTITIREDDILQGLDNFPEFDANLFETFLGQLQAFVSFLQWVFLNWMERLSWVVSTMVPTFKSKTLITALYSMNPPDSRGYYFFTPYK